MAQLFKLYDVQQYDSSELGLNRYWFWNPSATEVSAQAVGEAFVNDWLDTIRGIQSQWVDHLDIGVEEVIEGVDTALVNVLSGVGSRGGNSQPSFTQFSFYLRPVGPVIKRGGKRYMGVSEDDTNNNVATGTIGNQLENVRQLLMTGLQAGTVDLVHAVVRRFLSGGSVFYRVSPVVGAAYRAISTQRSRLAGNGTLSIPFFGLSESTLTATDLSAWTSTNFDAEITDNQTATWSQTLEPEAVAERQY